MFWEKKRIKYDPVDCKLNAPPPFQACTRAYGGHHEPVAHFQVLTFTLPCFYYAKYYDRLFIQKSPATLFHLLFSSSSSLWCFFSLVKTKKPLCKDLSIPGYRSGSKWRLCKDGPAHYVNKNGSF